ncbi:transcription termination factor Rho [Aggregicoccus sp. 17bor-14]|uniref:transcription termination factor Rho n=1 Tax=Myxococcaceae TaxID=31 RepID=UPI00129C8622|nr:MULTISPECIES: transcription termination factor Rho [Myxococcaceae]MBF5044884.1 transcription termination factor Rho [Simulacricoccus sp. 17bor-14]MRI90628.1 transcription termination factor Rho [Aggregicoccus sp. 17bor-14]
MSENSDNRDPNDLPPPQAVRPEGSSGVSAGADDEGDDEGDEGPDEGEGSGAAPGQGGAPGQPGAPGTGRRRRRRRRRRGAQVLFTPEGQAYRMTAGPDGQQVQVFLTPQELEQYQQRLAQQQQQQAQQGQQQQQQQGRPQHPHGGGQQQQQRGHGGGHPQQQQQRGEANLTAVEGVLDTEAKGPNAFLRQVKKNLLPAPDDAELPKNLVQKLRLRTGQFIQAQAQMRGNKGLVQRVDSVDGRPPEQAARLPHFGDLTSIDPVERIKLENGHKEYVTRVLDLIAPLGKGQRGLIVAPPKTGKTIMLQRIAQAVLTNHPEMHVMVVLIDERPEEVTDMRRSIKAEVLASSSDRNTADHLRVAEIAIERARRLVESGKDVLVLLDSITRLARAYNKEGDSSGRTMTGGVDSRALERPKRLFGAARATEEAGTLTIIGTALIDTGSRMDEVIFEEFKGTGNSEVTLDRLLAEKRIFPAINVPQSGTRKEEKLFTHKEYEKVKKLRGMLFSVKPVEAMEALVKRLSRYTYNDEFLDEL